MSFALAAGLAAALGWGLVDVWSALAGRRIGSLRVQVGTLAASFIGLAALLAIRSDLLGDVTAAGVLAGLPVGAFAAIGYLSYFTALRLGPISIVSPIAVTFGGLTVVLSVLLRGESLSAAQAAGAVMATVGVAMASVAIEPGARLPKLVGPGVGMALLTVVAFGLLSLVTVGPVEDHGWLAILIGSRIGNLAVGSTLLAVVRRVHVPAAAPLLEPGHGLDRTTATMLLLSGTADVAAFAVFTLGLAEGPVWQVGLASSFGPVLVVAYAIARLGERLRSVQWLGVGLLGAGVVLLAASG